LNIKRQTDQTEKTIIHHQDEIIAALKSIQGRTIFATATKFKKMMLDLILIKFLLKLNISFLGKKQSMIYKTYLDHFRK